MGVLLAFAPFIAFAVIDRLIGPTQGLFAALIVSVALLVRDWVRPGRAPKILEIGTALLFGGLALYTAFAGPIWSVIGVRLCVDIGLLLIVLISLAVGRPFTLQYAQEQVASEFWGHPDFVRINNTITAVWALAFFVMVIAELALLYLPGVPHGVGVVAIVLALVGAVKFTGWYPEHAKGLHNS
jgi:hypothetical protein